MDAHRYARRSKTERGEWSDFTRDYFLHREVLANVLLLVDSSVPPQDIDLESADWLGDSQVPYTLVFTKVRGSVRLCTHDIGYNPHGVCITNSLSLDLL